MLLGSHGDAIHLLPALPDEWQSGSVTGLQARSNFEVDIEWNGGGLTRATIRSGSGNTCRVWAKQALAVERKDDGMVRAHRDGNLLVFETTAGEVYHILQSSS